MKKPVKFEEMSGKIDQLIPNLPKNGILSLQEMYFVKGGDGEGGGDIIIIPPKQKLD